jgi:tetratricopeptide (TPR) repeat protein
MTPRWLFGACCAALLCAAPLTAVRAQAGRLLEASAVTARNDHVDLSIDFSCSLRYQTHTPAAEGDRVRVTLAIGADCSLAPGATFPVERLLPADGRDLVRSIELQPGLAGGAELVISWNRIEKFVLAPTGGMRGLRVRVQRRPDAQVSLGEPAAPDAGYAVNLESSRVPFEQVAVAAAAAKLQAPVYVSEVMVDEQRWYRMRAGPFETRRAANAILRTALSDYPGAWLAIDDETTPQPVPESTPPPSAAPPRAPEMRTDPTLDRRLDAARTAMSRRQYDDAIAQLIQVVTSEDYVHRIDAAELLGLARERRGQLAQAKAAYEDYLRRYPDSRAAARIRDRLQALRTASLPGRRGSGGGEGRDGWIAYGGASQVYRRDDTRLSSAALSRNLTTQNALLTDADGVVRHRGTRYDFTARSSFGYMKDLQPAGREDRLRVSAAYVELGDRELGIGARLGRQSRGMAGVNGLFDGLLGNWQAGPRLGASFAFGAPVENTRQGLASKRQFLGVATDFVLADHRWEGSVFALAQQYSGEIDRRSIGIEARYLRPGRTLMVTTDYDVHFGALNNAMVLGTLITDSRWTFNLDASRQRSPQLGIRNALVGQPTLVFDELFTQFTVDQIEQLAKDRSALVTQFSLSAAHPLGERGQWTVNLLSLDLSGTPASGGVAAVPSPGRDDAISSELLMNSLFRAGDTQSVAVRYQRGGSGDMMSVGIGSRLPLAAGFRLTSRLRADRRTIDADGSTQWIYAPSLRLDFQRGSSSFELEAGVELNRRHDAASSERNTRRFISAGYRLYLDSRRQ